MDFSLRNDWPVTVYYRKGQLSSGNTEKHVARPSVASCQLVRRMLPLPPLPDFEYRWLANALREATE